MSQSPPPDSYDFRRAPGHLIRRAHQVAVAMFMEETAAFDVTPVQFAILNALMDAPGIDQVSLAGRVALDAATSGSVIGRLEAKGWVRREPDVGDRRRRLLWVTPAGVDLAQAMRVAVERAQLRITGALSSDEADALQGLLTKLVAGFESGERGGTAPGQ